MSWRGRHRISSKRINGGWHVAYELTRLGGKYRAVIASSILAFLLLAYAAEGFPASSVNPLSPNDKNQLAILGAGVVGAAIEAPLIKDPTKYYQPIRGTWQYRITSGDKKGQSYAESLTPIPKNAQGATWRRSRPQYDDLISITGDSIHLSNEVDHDHGLLVQFKPRGFLLTSTLKPGESRTMKGTAHAFKLSDPTTEYKTFTMEETYTYVGAYKVKTPAGIFDALLFRNDFKVSSGSVTVDDSRYSFFAEGVGKVAGIEQAHATVLFFFHFSEKIPKVLVDYPRSGKGN
jgi:hypothetical protein